MSFTHQRWKRNREIKELADRYGGDLQRVSGYLKLDEESRLQLERELQQSLEQEQMVHKKKCRTCDRDISGEGSSPTCELCDYFGNHGKDHPVYHPYRSSPTHRLRRGLMTELPYEDFTADTHRLRRDQTSEKEPRWKLERELQQRSEQEQMVRKKKCRICGRDNSGEGSSSTCKFCDYFLNQGKEVYDPFRSSPTRRLRRDLSTEVPCEGSKEDTHRLRRDLMRDLQYEGSTEDTHRLRRDLMLEKNRRWELPYEGSTEHAHGLRRDIMTKLPYKGSTEDTDRLRRDIMRDLQYEGSTEETNRLRRDLMLEKKRRWELERELQQRSEQELRVHKNKCRICDRDISGKGSSSTCKFCDYFRNQGKDHHVNHPFHSSHPLILRTKGVQTFICNSCHKMHEDVDMYFTCDRCDFFMDVKCVIMPPITRYDFENPDGKQIRHFTHQHRMPLISDGVDEINCFVCRLKCSSSDEVYGCRRCDYFLHESCAKLPPQIEGSSYHSDHSLFFHTANRAFRSCKSCNKDNLIFTFECGQCSFTLCVNCATTITLTVKFDCHEHPLHFLERTDTNLMQCDSYDSYCKRPSLIDSNEFNHTKSSIFSCAKCNFKLHLLCGMLPNTIKFEYHEHPLVLADLVIENNYGDYCCDICESERDPRFCVYFCHDCKFVAHVHCLYSQIVNVLKRELKNVKLITVGNDVWEFPGELKNVWVAEKEQGRSICTLLDLLYQLSGDELETFMTYFHWENENEEEHKTTQMELGEQINIDEVLRLYNFTESEQFMSVLFDEFRSSFCKKKFEIKPSDLSLKIVPYKGYSIPLNLASVLKNILQTYGDIGETCTSSPTMKSVGVFFICKVLKQMHSTLIADITKDLLYNWYSYISFAKEIIGFKVEFLDESLEKITQVFFCRQLNKLLGMDIPKLLHSKMAELEKEMTECKARLEKYNEFRDSTSSKESMKEHLSQGLQLMWKTAGQVGRHCHNSI